MSPRLPFGEALAVADSAARHGEQALLRRAAITARGPGSPQIRRVIEASRGEAANPFESGLRAIALDVAGLEVEPQVLIRSEWGCSVPTSWTGSVGSSSRLTRSSGTVTAQLFAAMPGGTTSWSWRGWIVLRFAWEDVMFDPGYVHRVLVAVVGLVEERTQVLGCTCGAA